jgi:hypothetical protein
LPGAGLEPIPRSDFAVRYCILRDERDTMRGFRLSIARMPIGRYVEYGVPVTARFEGVTVT